MANFKEKLNNFMYGRYGFDKLNFFLFILYMICFLVSLFFPKLQLVFNILLLVVFVLMLLRMFSRNFEKRRRENEVFLKVWNPVELFFSVTWKRFRDRKTHKYIKCPSCKRYLRIKKGKGEREVTCPLCKDNITVNS